MILISKKEVVSALKQVFDKYNIGFGGSSGGFSEAVAKAIENISEYNRWILCTDRLPYENQNVIACFAHGTVTELRFYDGKFHGIYDYNTNVIVAWQPLPEPYRN